MRPVIVVVSLAACTGGEPTDPQQTGRPVASWSEESLEIGPVPLGSSADATFDITNTGGSALEIYTVILSDGDRDEWTITWDSAAPALARNESLTVTVTYAPEQADDIDYGRVQVRTNDDDTPTFFIQVIGTSAASNADNDGDGYTVAQGDCDDDNPGVNPGATEACNGIDDDCSGAPNPNEADADGDGVRVCQNDCNDGNASIYPGAPEACDGQDSDCDGVNQDNQDNDGDTYTPCDGDCNDNTPNVSPDGIEVCGDSLDNDCDGQVDVVDGDGDGHNVCSPTGDCDDANALAHPIIVAPGGSPTGAGTPADPVDTPASGLAIVDAVCRTVFVEPGTYPVTGVSWTAGDVTLRGRGADRSEVVFDAGGAGRHFDISGGAMTVNRVTLSGGVGPAGQAGGSVRVTNASFTAVNSDFLSNSSTGAGGAIRAVGGNVSLQQACGFDGNSGSSGGAVSLDGTTFFDPNGSIFSNNTASATGGAVHANNATLLMTGSSFVANSAVTGGGLAVEGGGGHLVQRGVFQDNDATTAGGLYISGTTDGLFRNHVIRDSTGGGARITGAATATLANNTFTSNVTADQGSALYVDSDGATVLGNIAHFNDGQSGFYAPVGSLATVQYNTVFATSTFGGDFAGALVVGVDENLSENPGFVAFTDDGDPANDDLSLGGTSPAVDTGPPDPAYNDTDGTRNDRGHTGGPGGL